VRAKQEIDVGGGADRRENPKSPPRRAGKADTG
jgi:hypothetical protein